MATAVASCTRPMVPSRNGRGFADPMARASALAKGIPSEWTEKDYNWKATLPGLGIRRRWCGITRSSSPSAVGRDGRADRVVPGHRRRASTLWERRYPSHVHPKHSTNSFASATPALDRDHVYVSWSTPEQYTVLALESRRQPRLAGRLGTGRQPAQHRRLADRVRGHGDHGQRSGWARCTDNPESGISFLMALNASDGQVRWRTERNSAVVSYSTPCVYHSPETGKPELIFNSQAHGISSIDPYTGPGELGNRRIRQAGGQFAGHRGRADLWHHRLGWRRQLCGRDPAGQESRAGL